MSLAYNNLRMHTAHFYEILVSMLSTFCKGGDEHHGWGVESKRTPRLVLGHLAEWQWHCACLHLDRVRRSGICTGMLWRAFRRGGDGPWNRDPMIIDGL